MNCSRSLRCVTLAALLFGFSVSSAQALTICVGRCDTLPGGDATEPIDLPDLSDLVTTGVDGLVLETDAFGLIVNAIGDVVVHVPSGVFDGPELRLCAGEQLQMGRTDGSETIEINGDLWLGTGSFCMPMESELDTFTAEVLHLTIAAPQSGPLIIYAAGNILYTNTPVPEPGAGSLLALGLVALARHRDRARRVWSPL